MRQGYEKTIFELSGAGKRGYRLPPRDPGLSLCKEEIPENLRRKDALLLPQVSEQETVRHYTRLSQKNYGLDSGFYPLGSCTMKYNPKISEDVAADPRFSGLHPYQPEETVQGALALMHELSAFLCEITGMDEFSLQPAAGAQGELCGLMMIKRYYESKGEPQRKTIIVPDSSHGTNPASAARAGFSVLEIRSNEEGSVDLSALSAALGGDTAGLMLTNPNTLGLFEKDILQISDMVHKAGGLLYYDGANLNAILGKVRPGDMGFDIMHVNTHKTFATPHGGGGPGAGPVGAAGELTAFLPSPRIVKEGDSFEIRDAGSESIGKVRGYYGSFSVLLRAWTYIRMMGADGLSEVSDNAVLNANYLKEKLKAHYRLPYDHPCMHEFVLTKPDGSEQGLGAADFAKRLIEFGFHPPTICFPLIVHDALMIEPTETESKETLDDFITAMIEIAEEAKNAPEKLRDAPQTGSVLRVDELLAAKTPVLTWREEL